MLEVVPNALQFREVRLNQAYAASLCITNPLPGAVDFILKPSSSRYTITPNRVNLKAGQSIVVTVRLLLSHYPNYNRGVKSFDDTIQIKSTYFDQRVAVSFFLLSRDSTTRSSSPAANRLSQYTSDAAIVTALHEEIAAKDNKIKKLEDIVGLFQKKNPAIHEIVQSRVEQERLIFEEKSEKVLKILRRKDELIENLQDQLKVTTKYLHDHSFDEIENKPSQSQMRGAQNKQKIGSHGAASEGSPSSSLPAESAEEREAHQHIRRELQTAHDDAIRFEEQWLQAEKNLDITAQQLRSANEESADQKEQIQVLVAEISRLRRETESETGFSPHYLESCKIEIEKLNEENTRLRRSRDELQTRSNELLSTVEAFKTQLTNAAGDMSAVGTGALGDTNRTVLKQEEVADSRLFNDSSSFIELYRERLARAEADRDSVLAELRNSAQVEERLRERCDELQRLVVRCEAECATSEAEIQRLHKERDDALQSADTKELQLRNLLASSSPVNAQPTDASAAIALNKAHTWWAYVWHEARREERQERLASASDGRLVDADTVTMGGKRISIDFTDIDRHGIRLLSVDPRDVSSGSAEKAIEALQQENVSLQAHLLSSRESLKAMAVDLTAARQELLGRQLASRRETDALREQVDLAEREAMRQTAFARTHKADREIKIAELSKTIRILSSRSELHAEIAKARQEVETEKLAIHHLKDELESYKHISDSEQRKASSLRKEVAELRQTLDSAFVLKSVTNLPGVEPATLIEVMGGKLVQLMGDLARTHSELKHAQTQINSLQRLAGGPRKGEGPRKAGKYATTLAGTDSSAEALNADSLMEGGDGDTKNQLPDSISVPVSMSCLEPFNLVIDGETTPQKVLDSLDAAVLAQRVLSQDSTISELRAQLEQFEADLLRLESVRMDDRAQYESQARVALDASVRRQEVLQVGYDELKLEVTVLKERNASLELRARENEIQKSEDDARKSLVALTRGDAPHRRNDSIDVATAADNASFEENVATVVKQLKNEIAQLKFSLREKTVQHRIASETLESLQFAGSRVKSDPAEVALGINLVDGVVGSMPSVEISWGMEALVKRVVELSAELATQYSVAHFEQHRAVEIENENRKRSREINRLKATVKQQEEANTELLIKLEAASAHAREAEKSLSDSEYSTQRHTEDLLGMLRDAEVQTKSDQITIDELRKQVETNEDLEFKEWIESIILGDAGNTADDPAVTAASFDFLAARPQNQHNQQQGVIEDEEGVRTLVSGLLQQWQEYVGTYPGTTKGRPGASGSASSKAEQRFLQRVVDLVMQAHGRCVKAMNEARAADYERTRCELTLRVCRDRLRACIAHLHRYRRRSRAAEKVLESDRQHFLQLPIRATSALQKTLVAERVRAKAATHALNSLKREHLQLEAVCLAEAAQVRRLQVRVAELEAARSDASISARDDAARSLENQVADIEGRFQGWVKSELPRLVSGLPVTENLLGPFRDNKKPGFKFDGMGYQMFPEVDLKVDLKAATDAEFAQSLGGRQPISDRLLSTLGIDRCYALTQALCSLKAQHSSQEAYVLALEEKNSVLRDQKVELEGVLHRWRAQVEKVDSLAAGRSSSAPASHTQSEIDDLSSALAHTHDLAAHASKTEEINISLEVKLAHAQRRAEDLQAMVDTITRDETLLKTQTAQHVAHVTRTLEQTHATQLAAVRATYEEQRRALTGELNRVAFAVEEAAESVGWKALTEKMAMLDVLATDAAATNATTRDKKTEKEKKEHRPRPRGNGADAAPDDDDDDDIGRDVSGDAIQDRASKFHPEPPASLDGGNSDTSEASPSVRNNASSAGDISGTGHSTKGRAKIARSGATVLGVAGTKKELASGKKKTRGASPAPTVPKLSAVPPESARQTRVHSSSTHDSSVDASTPRTDTSAAAVSADILRAKDELIAMQKTANATLERQVDDLAQTMKAERERLLEEQSELKKAKDNTSLLKNQLEAASFALQLEKTRANEATSELRDLEIRIEAQREALQRKITTLEKDHAAALSHSHEAAAARDAAATTAAASLREEIQHWKLRAAQSDNDLTALRAECDSLRREAEYARTRDSSSSSSSSAHEMHTQEMQDVFDKLYHTQEAIIQSLEAQVAELRSRLLPDVIFETHDAADLVGPASGQRTAGVSSAATPAPGPVASSSSSYEGRGLANSEERLRELEMKYKHKEQELSTVMRVLSLPGAGGSVAAVDESLTSLATGFQGPVDTSAATASLEQQHYQNEQQQQHQQKDDASAAASRVAYMQHYESRLAAADEEIGALSRAINDERRHNAELREHISENERMLAESVGSSGPTATGAGTYSRHTGRSEGVGSSHFTPHPEEHPSSARYTPTLPSGGNIGGHGQGYSYGTHNTTAAPPSTTTPIGHDLKSALFSVENFQRDALMHELEVPEGRESSRELAKTVVKRYNELRRLARNEVNRLRDILQAVQRQHILSEDESARLRAALDDARTHIQALKDENGRKAKLLASIRMAKAADSNALEQWRAEHKELEETNKRLQRSVASKDTIIKELRAKVEMLEAEYEKVSGESLKPGVGKSDTNNNSPPTDISNLPISELRTRLRSSELERVRARSRVSLLKGKISEFESSLKVAEDEVERLKGANERLEAALQGSHRKEDMLKHLRLQVDKVKDENDRLREANAVKQAELERKNRVLQRQFEEAVRELSKKDRKIQMEISEIASEVLLDVAAGDRESGGAGPLLRGSSGTSEAEDNLLGTTRLSPLLPHVPVESTVSSRAKEVHKEKEKDHHSQSSSSSPALQPPTSARRASPIALSIPTPSPTTQRDLYTYLSSKGSGGSKPSVLGDKAASGKRARGVKGDNASSLEARRGLAQEYDDPRMAPAPPEAQSFSKSAGSAPRASVEMSMQASYSSSIEDLTRLMEELEAEL